ncbi:MAG TPA: tetratricopeptide repeat protein [Blastocatellia bacterium]|nr:tetratricopeptide repeat protein [Blastocatellia bacterium]
MTEKSERKSSTGSRQLIALDTGIGGMPFGGEEFLTESEAERKREALHFFQQAYEAQMRGELDEAADLYRQSIESYATAEAHTFLGWTYSFMGLRNEAIEECHRAIEVDPDFGNPYNDIGAYLIEAGNLHGAIPWLQRGMRARRYEAYFYPHFNLGRVYEAMGRWFEALHEYQTAVRLNPKYTLAIAALRRLQGRLN